MIAFKCISSMMVLSLVAAEHRYSGGYNANAGQYNANAGQYNANAGQYNANAGQYNANAGQYNANAGQYNANAGPYSAGNSQYGGAHIPILSYENVNNGDGNYRYSYETGNGISAHERGSPRAQGPEGPAVTAEGGFSYRAPDGQQISLTYTADENGFHPTGSHIPTPPPIPEAILRSLEFNRQHPSSGEGSYNGGYNRNYNY